MKTPDSEVVRLSAFHGKKILLNFFATCCFPCKDEASHLKVAYECNSYEVVYFRVTSQDTPESEYVLAEEHELPFKLALNESGKVGEANKVRGLSTSFYIRPDGVVHYVMKGSMTKELIELILESQQSHE